MPRTMIDNGVEREMTPLEEAAFEAGLPTLEDRKAGVCARIDARRDALIDGGFTHTVDAVEYTFQSRQSDRENILGLALAAQMAIAQGAQADDLEWLTPETDFNYITADNTLAPMDAFEVLALYQRGLSFKAGQTFYARGLKDAALAAADDAALDAIDIEAGWPA